MQLGLDRPSPLRRWVAASGGEPGLGLITRWAHSRDQLDLFAFFGRFSLMIPTEFGLFFEKS